MLKHTTSTCSNCARVAYNSDVTKTYNSLFAESKLDRVTGGICGILLNHLTTDVLEHKWRASLTCMRNLKTGPHQ